MRLRIGNALESRRRFAERLRAQGKAVPFIPLELPDSGNGHDFASGIEAVLRERMRDEDFDVDYMAEAMAMSRATLYRKADEILGASPKELLWTFRLRQAAHWLRETDGTVSEVAYGCGLETVPPFHSPLQGALRQHTCRVPQARGMMRNAVPPGCAGRSVIVFRTHEKRIDSLVRAMGMTRLAILVMLAAMLPATTSAQVDERRGTGAIAGVITDSISGSPSREPASASG